MAEAFQVTVVGAGGDERAQQCISPPFQRPGGVLWLRANHSQHVFCHTAKVEATAGSLGGMIQEGTCGEVAHKHKSPPSKAGCPHIFPRII